MSEKCPFCEIVHNHDTSVIRAFTDDAVVIEPLNPATEGHLLVIPKEHYDDFMDMPTDATNAVFEIASEIARRVKGSLSPDGMNLITSAGAAATQTVFHCHVHVVPRWDGDRMGRIWPEKEVTG